MGICLGKWRKKDLEKFDGATGRRNLLLMWALAIEGDQNRDKGDDAEKLDEREAERGRRIEISLAGRFMACCRGSTFEMYWHPQDAADS